MTSDPTGTFRVGVAGVNRVSPGGPPGCTMRVGTSWRASWRRSQKSPFVIVKRRRPLVEHTGESSISESEEAARVRAGHEEGNVEPLDPVRRVEGGSGT